MKHERLTYLVQRVAMAILLAAGILKLIGLPMEVDAFSRLGVEPVGRYAVGCLELVIAVLLLTPFAAVGALLGLLTMCAACIAHAFVYGFFNNPQDFLIVAALGTVTYCCMYVLRKRGNELPFFGKKQSFYSNVSEDDILKI